ncbi:MAG: hypothetical protein R6T96_00765, partial [Longimicrobiales bacterium]
MAGLPKQNVDGLQNSPNWLTRTTEEEMGARSEKQQQAAHQCHSQMHVTSLLRKEDPTDSLWRISLFKPIQNSPNRIFNCAYMPVDHPDSFAEAMFLLLGGTGVGYSVQRHHVSELPAVV